MILRMLIKKQAIASFCMLLLFTSCYWIPCNFTSSLKTFKTEQKEEFFIGEYVVEKFINGGIDISNLSIKINKDKTMEIYNIPKNILDLTEFSKDILNVKGEWDLNYLKERKKENYFLSVSLKYKKRNKVIKSGRAWSLYIKKNKPVILVKVGDPDECTAIRLIKK